MLICGLKLTHDGSVALIEDGNLIFSIELEKINNNSRYEEIKDTAFISDLLKQYGYDITSIDYFAVDGWGGDNQNALAIQPRLEIGDGHNVLSISNQGQPYSLKIGQYEEESMTSPLLKEWEFNGLQIDEKTFSYRSYLHVASHVLSAYCTSEFAKTQESSYILVWDGGMYPRLYFFNAEEKQIENLGPIFLLIGNIYTLFSQHFGPYKVEGDFAKDNLSIAGKVMAYIALGKVKEELFEIFDDIYSNHYSHPMGFGNVFANECKKRISGQGYSDEDILCTFHAYMEEMLVSKLKKKVMRLGQKSKNICIAGGCALNIKWNSAIRESGFFDEVYVPPFPNDSGSAIGAACCAMFSLTNNYQLKWNVYSGPEIITNNPAEGWTKRECSLQQLAQLLHDTNEPIVFLNGRAELGPRALGNRSIIAAAVSENMKAILNKIKRRESYRPVSPICLDERAGEIFKPGKSDPYMLFDHDVKEEWKKRIPAIMHIDGTARLQTITKDGNPTFYELLSEYDRISGIPLLCNTSANFNGCGFFPDIHSAMSWDGTNYVWCNQMLYEKTEKNL